MASSPSTRRPGPSRPAPAALEARDWAALPRDIILDVFLRLGHREVMLGAEFACTAWRRAALEEPTLWRRVGMENPTAKLWRRVGVHVEMEMKLAAVGRAAGQCEAFKGDSDDDYLLELVERAPSLKRLNLIEHYSDNQSDEVLVEALKKLTLLEDLQIYFTRAMDCDENLLLSVCQACPHLKKLMLCFALGVIDFECNEPIDGEISMMHELHVLELANCVLRGKGLKSILDSCPRLETLDISGYFDKDEMDKELQVKCARIKNLRLPTRRDWYDSYDDDSYYKFAQEEDYDSEEEEENSYY